jgi:hypothetical protein
MFKMFRLFLLLSLAVFLAACSQPSPAEQPAAPTTAAAPIDPADEVVPETGSATETPSETEALEGEQPAQVDINCSSPAALTPRATEGPYYSAGSPERTSLVEDLPGTRLLLTGYVLDMDCQPGARRMDRFLASRQPGGVRQCWLHPARSPVHGRERAVHARNRRSWAVSRAHRTYSCQSAGARRPRARHSVILPGCRTK